MHLPFLCNNCWLFVFFLNEHLEKRVFIIANTQQAYQNIITDKFPDTSTKEIFFFFLHISRTLLLEVHVFIKINQDNCHLFYYNTRTYVHFSRNNKFYYYQVLVLGKWFCTILSYKTIKERHAIIIKYLR